MSPAIFGNTHFIMQRVLHRVDFIMPRLSRESLLLSVSYLRYVHYTIFLYGLLFFYIIR